MLHHHMAVRAPLLYLQLKLRFLHHQDMLARACPTLTHSPPIVHLSRQRGLACQHRHLDTLAPLSQRHIRALKSARQTLLRVPLPLHLSIRTHLQTAPALVQQELLLHLIFHRRARLRFLPSRPAVLHRHLATAARSPSNLFHLRAVLHTATRRHLLLQRPVLWSQALRKLRQAMVYLAQAPLTATRPQVRKQARWSLALRSCLQTMVVRRPPLPRQRSVLWKRHHRPSLSRPTAAKPLPLPQQKLVR